MKCLTLVSRFFRILKSDTRVVGRFPDVIIFLRSSLNFSPFKRRLFIGIIFLEIFHRSISKDSRPKKRKTPLKTAR